MANEKQLLKRELDRWKRRHAEIEARLAEIADKERRLLALVPDAGSLTGSVAATAGNTESAPAPASNPRIKVQTFSY